MIGCYSLTHSQLDLLPKLEQVGEVGFEIRLDSFPSLDEKRAAADFAFMRSATSKPLLATYRSRPHLGQADPASRAEQGWMLRRAALRAGFDWIDIELDEPEVPARIAEIRERGAKSLLSQHLLEAGTALEPFYERLASSGADLIKLIATGGGASDLVAQRRLYRSAQGRPLLHFYMGSDFAATRILSLLYGAPFTFLAADPNQMVAPGQLGLADLLETYQPHVLDPAKLKLFGVIGSPIGHSKSPSYHNPRLRAKDGDALFLALACKSAEDLAQLRACFPELRGLAVTKPMKEPAFALAEGFLDPHSATLGAVNTLLFAGGRVEATNTDLLAMIEILGERLDPSRDLVRILGYGGLGKAVVRACEALGLRVQVCNRSQARLSELPKRVECLPWEARSEGGATVLVQCTSAGMGEQSEESPLTAFWPGLRLLIETIYNPLETKLMRQAQDQGLTVLNGMVLFEKQAEIQSRLMCQHLEAHPR